jgi:tetratricopeptide (TPR) repeat protein
LFLSIDGETQALLDGLVESLPTAALLLLVNFRPEYHHQWAGKTYYRQLRIDPLPPESAQELLRALLGDGADLAPLKRLLVARTEGNPFFLEESVRTLVETGPLAGERGAYRLTRRIDHLQIPGSVQAILAARIDRLAPEDKRLLQAAAVIGKDVPLPLLLAIADASEQEMCGGLGRLGAAEFLYETRLFPDLEYTFKHALTHEVAYGSLLHDRRRELHARIARAIENLSPDRRALGLTFVEQGDSSAAIPLLERGLTLCETWTILDWSITIESGLGVACALTGRFEDALALQRRAEAEEPYAPQGFPAARILRFGETCWLAGRIDDARPHAEQALDLARAGGERGGQTRALRLLGDVAAGSDRPDAERSERYFRQSLALAEELGMRQQAARCHLGLGKLYRRTGRRQQAQEHLTTTTRLFREMDMRFWLEQAEAAMRELA